MSSEKQNGSAPPYPYPQQQQPYMPLPPQYPHPQSNTIVMQQQPQQPMVVATTIIKPQSWLGLAIFSALCCNPILGIIAIVLSCMSDSSYSDGQIEDARKFGKISMIVSLVSVLTGIIVIGVLIYFFTRTVTTTVDLAEDAAKKQRDSVGFNTKNNEIDFSG